MMTGAESLLSSLLSFVYFLILYWVTNDAGFHLIAIVNYALLVYELVIFLNQRNQ